MSSCSIAMGTPEAKAAVRTIFKAGKTGGDRWISTLPQFNLPGTGL
jgi:hypothetical protein